MSFSQYSINIFTPLFQRFYYLNYQYNTRLNIHNCQEIVFSLFSLSTFIILIGDGYVFTLSFKMKICLLQYLQKTSLQIIG